MDLVTTIFFWISVGVVAYIVLSFLFQLSFGLLFILPVKKHPKTEPKHSFTFVIKARDEENVIGNCVDSCFKCDYPKELMHVVVFCHNCSDNTAKVAREHGAEVIEINDDNPKHKNAGYCLYYGFKELKENQRWEYDYFLILDADNEVDKNYLRACNDAANAGVQLGRTYENSKNLTQNMYSCMSGLWYIRDNRIASHSRQALHLGTVMNGCCSFIKAEYCLEWDCLTSSEDLEFTVKMLYKHNLKCEYIEDAILYEEEPTTIDDIRNRNGRMGNAVHKLFWTHGFKLLGAFFKNLFNFKIPFSTKLSYLDQFTNLESITAAFVALIWLPFYFVFTIVTGVIKGGPLVVLNGSGGVLFDFTWWSFFVVCIIAASLAYFIPFFIEPLVCFITERKKLVITNKKIMFWSIVLFPFFMLLTAFSIFRGILTKKSNWQKINRTSVSLDEVKKDEIVD